MINGGGIINVAPEVRAIERNERYDGVWAEEKLSRLMVTLDDILQRSRGEGIPTNLIADQIARDRLGRAG